VIDVQSTKEKAPAAKPGLSWDLWSGHGVTRDDRTVMDTRLSPQRAFFEQPAEAVTAATSAAQARKARQVGRLLCGYAWAGLRRLSKKHARALVDTAHALTAIQSLIRFVQKSLVSSRKFQLTVLLG
jgi:hypothetical protein